MKASISEFDLPCNEEFVNGMVAIAVPIMDEKGKLIATVAVHAPTQRMSLEDAIRYAPRLRESAARDRESFLDTAADIVT